MTSAELVVFRFEHAAKTISIPALAKDYGFEREVTGEGELIYNFPDGSRLITKGRGRSHTMHTDVAKEL